MTPRDPGPLVGIGAALLSGALIAFASALHPLWWAAWIAPVPVLWVARGLPQRGFWLGLLTGLVGGVSLARYYAAVAGPIPTLAIIVLGALAWAVMIRTAAAAQSRLAPALAVFALPAIWAALDTVVAAASPHGSAGSLAYSQAGFAPVVQVAALGGTAAVVFCIGLFASTLLLALRTGRGALWPQILPLLAPVAILSVALIWGAVRVEERAAEPPAAPGVAVAIISGDGYEGSPADWNRIWPPYARAIEAAAAGGARVAVLPEKIAGLGPVETAAAADEVAALARSAGIDIVVGLLANDGSALHNRALFAESSGRQSWYDKQHLVPGWEGRIVPGQTPLVVDTTYGRVGIAICKDMDFARLGRDYARAGAELMLVPAWDFRGAWGADGESHGNLAVLRGVEGGFSVARSARIGYLTLSDPAGRLVAHRRSDPVVAMVTVPLPAPRTDPTVYARTGDLFGWLCVAAAIAIAIFSGADTIWRRRGRVAAGAISPP
jgi:apolipoprotein N-acyltransferase